jgi:ADP-ribose pyrophosphatase YjhB (NUDIX family)
MHHIQRDILIKLAAASSLRFSELQPHHVPNNTFSYHLKKLLEAGYVESTNVGYVATRKALKVIQDIDSRQRYTRPLVLIVLCITNDLGEVLLIKRDNRPFKDWLGIPSGNIHGGESLQHAVVRTLYEKTSVTVELDDLTPKGVLDFRYLQKDSNDMFIHAIGFVFSYHYTGERSLLEDKKVKWGVLSWSDLKNDDILPEVYTVLELANQKNMLVQSIDFAEPMPLVDSELEVI